jgi:hypothetical protein
MNQGLTHFILDARRSEGSPVALIPGVAVDLSIRAAALSQVAARAKKAEIHARAFSWWRISSHPTTQSSSKRDLLAAAGPQYFRLEGNLGSKPQSRRRSCEGKKNFCPHSSFKGRFVRIHGRTRGF